MNAFKAIWGGITGLFKSDGGKSIIRETADIVDNYHPGEVTKHNMAVEDVKVGDESQAAARQYEPSTSGGGGFNSFVDGLNRLPRPLFAIWAFGELTGILPSPTHLNNMHPIVLNIIWSIVGFYFGVRMISQDFPKIFEAWYKIRASMK